LLHNFKKKLNYMDSWGSLDILAGFGICRLVEAVMKIPADPCSNRGESVFIIFMFSEGTLPGLGLTLSPFSFYQVFPFGTYLLS